MIDSERLLARFLRYVQIDTTAVDETDIYPSSPGQWELGRMLVHQLRDCGLEAFQDEYALVHATIPASVPYKVPVIAFNAHLDTSPETSGANVNPQVIRGYTGGDLVLPGDTRRVITTRENPELNALKGATLITTDGTTLLGADDKAGVAVIMELAAHFSESPEVPHGPVRLLFTCDEEIGRGVQHVDVDQLNAVACYTLDGPGANQVDVETFSADLATVRVRGVNLHPSIAKDRMVNAVRAAGLFVARLPRDMAPETTEGRDGFLHPYSITGGVAEVRMAILLRDFETARLAELAVMLRRLAEDVQQEVPGSKIDVEVRPQYRNLREGLAREPRAVEFALEAHRNLGREPKQTIIRGGTDGSQLTARGLPTPNLSTGQHNPHSPLEWACLEEMRMAVEILAEASKIWAIRGRQEK